MRLLLLLEKQTDARPARRANGGDGAAIAAELCGEAIVLNFEFLHRLHGGFVIHVGVSAFALLRGTDQRAVHANLLRGVALAVGDEIRAHGIDVGGS
jgi:hypothetical protein